MKYRIALAVIFLCSVAAAQNPKPITISVESQNKLLKLQLRQQQVVSEIQQLQLRYTQDQQDLKSINDEANADIKKALLDASQDPEKMTVKYDAATQSFSIVPKPAPEKPATKK